jgi:hypothetical protein
MRVVTLLLLLCGACADQPMAVVDNGGGGDVATDGGAPALTGIQIASQKYPDLRTLWSRSVSRTCGPNNGVCHDNRQFPDLQTASGLLAAIGQRCNQIRDDPSTIDNLCEPSGDYLQLGSWKTHIGQVTATPSDAPTSVLITLQDPIPSGAGTAAQLVRQVSGLPAVTFAIPAAAVTQANAGERAVTLSYAALQAAHGFDKTSTLADFFVPAAFVPGSQTQVEMGDPNGDGVFGATLGGALIKPGDPMKSFLFLRVLGPMVIGQNPLTSMTATASSEAQMPIANQQYWDVDNDLVALWCWIQGMAQDGSNADGPINYAQCDMQGMPQATHQGGEASTFSSVYSSILVPACAGPCHHSGTSRPTTFYLGDLLSTYDQLVGIGAGPGPSESTTLPYVTRGDRTKSFLYLKVSGDPSAGAQMPLGGSLSPDQIEAIGAWIDQGGNND